MKTVTREEKAHVEDTCREIATSIEIKLEEVSKHHDDDEPVQLAWVGMAFDDAKTGEAPHYVIDLTDAHGNEYVVTVAPKQK